MPGETLSDVLRARARQSPDALALVFVAEDGTETPMTIRQFVDQALAYSQALQREGIGPGELVILVLRHSPALLLAFWGALLLGAIPSIFPFLTEKLDGEIYREQVRQLVDHAQARAVITFPEFRRELQSLLSGERCRVLDTGDLQAAREGATVGPAGFNASPESVAFLQHSSGTTGLQKGVALSHRAVLNQIRAYREAIQLSAQDVVVSWLPLYHDMGLIAGFVIPLVAGVPLVLLSPFHWVRNPAVLFRAVHEHRGTICWLPNFAYHHSVRAIRERDLQGLDLSRWRLIVNCSEPVRHESHQLFLQRFASCGIRPEALATCYAMAENTFAVTQSVPSQAVHVDWVGRERLQREGQAVPQAAGSAGATALVSCGYPIAGTEISILDPSGRRAGERIVGEILIRSNCMLEEYYHRPDLTRQAFLEEWYLTGDMGYVADAQLYVTGRKKDLIIVAGKNVYPQDVEALAASVPDVYPGRAVAFGVPDERLGTESIVLVCELDGVAGPEQRKQIEAELRQRVLQSIGVTLGDLRLVDERWLLKTSSGKIARALNREKYLREFRA
jgi:acyl-CoA synthetase (AMP-forming)/AMP-acid ligase II